MLTNKGTLQIPGKRDSPKFKRGMRDFLPECWEFGGAYV